MTNSERGPADQELRFLISSHTGLGNFILKTPMLMAISNEFPNAKIDIIGGGVDRAELVLQGADFIGDIHQFDTQWSFLRKIMFYWSLRNRSYDAVLVAFDDESRSLFLGSFICGAKKIYSHVIIKRKKRFFLRALASVFFPKLILVPFLAARHEIDLNFDLLQAFIDRPLARSYKTRCNFNGTRNILEVFGLMKGEYVVIQPGARSGAPTPKRWSLDKFKKFIVLFNKKYPNVKIVTIGNQYDFDNYAAELLESHNNIVNTAGLTTISEAAKIMQHAAVSVVHDSGAMHIGGAVEANMVALYGPTDFTRTRPLGENCTILFSKQTSFAEMFNLSSGEDLLIDKYGEDYCMDGISPQEVLGAVERYF